MRSIILVISWIFLLISACSVNSSDIEKISFEEHFLKGREYIISEDYDKAIDEYKKALRLKPDSGEAHYGLGISYDRKWKATFDAAQSRRLDAMFLNPSQHKKVLDSLKDQDKIYKHYGEKKEFKHLAIKEFNEALKYDPNNWGALYYVATDHLNNGFYDEAIKEYEQIIKIKPDYVNSYVLIANAYSKKGLYKIAIEKYKEALHIDPNEQESHYEMAKAYLKLNKRKEAETQLEILKKLDSTFYDDLKARLEFYDR